MRRNLLLSAIAVVVFFGLLELGLRASGRVPTNQLRSPDLRTLDAIPGMFEPGQDFIDRVVPDLPFRVRINSLGFRGREFTVAKPPGALRILCIGDSYTFGPYVEDTETFPAALERALNEGRPAGAAAIEVINGGASGFTITDELTFFRDKASSLEPDVVVLTYCQNDVLDMGRREPMIETMRDHARLKSRPVLGPTIRVLQRTALYNGMQRTAALIKVMRMRAQAITSDSATPDQWKRYGEGLGQFVETVGQRGTRLLLVIWISADQMSGKATLEPQRRLAELAGQLGLETLDLASAIRELEGSGVNPYFMPRDGHPNARGYEAAARATARRLVELSYLDPTGAGAPPQGRAAR